MKVSWFLTKKCSKTSSKLKKVEKKLKILNFLDKYEVCPESIGPTFISPHHSVRASSVGHERQQYSLTNRSVAYWHLPNVYFMRSVSLFTKLFLSSADFVIVKNDWKTRSTNLHQILFSTRKNEFGNYSDDAEGLWEWVSEQNMNKRVV